MGHPLIDNDWNDKAYPWLEWHLQAAVCAKVLLPAQQAGKFDFAADMNAGKRTTREQSLMKLTGGQAGEPDLRIYLPGGILMLVELKRIGGVLSKAQKNRHNTLRNLGFMVRVVIATTPQDAVNQVRVILKGYL